MPRPSRFGGQEPLDQQCPSDGRIRPRRWILCFVAATVVAASAAWAPSAGAVIPSGNVLVPRRQQRLRHRRRQLDPGPRDTDGEDFTVETFFYVDDANKTDGENDILFTKARRISAATSIFHNPTADVIVFQIDGAGTLSSTANLADGWHHIAYVFDNE